MRRNFTAILVSSYLAILIATSLWPKPIDGEGFLTIVTRDLLNFFQQDQELAWIQYSQLEGITNVMLYIPLGIFVVVLLKKLNPIIAALIPIVVSLIAESSQMLFLPERYATWQDVFNNSLGGVIGVAIAVSTRQLLKRKAQGD
jgi:VanZ family protein